MRPDFGTIRLIRCLINKDSDSSVNLEWLNAVVQKRWFLWVSLCLVSLWFKTSPLQVTFHIFKRNYDKNAFMTLRYFRTREVLNFDHIFHISETFPGPVETLFFFTRLCFCSYVMTCNDDFVSAGRQYQTLTLTGRPIQRAWRGFSCSDYDARNSVKALMPPLSSARQILTSA